VRSGTDCFLLKLDANLDRVYAKSFGKWGYSMSCNSIQVTRNADFIYIGGTYNSASLLFAKMNAYGDNVYA
jgi:hypothetical protein